MILEAHIHDFSHELAASLTLKKFSLMSPLDSVWKLVITHNLTIICINVERRSAV